MRHAICINNQGYEASLDQRKIYPVIEDTDAEQHGWLRIIDESGEDYLFEATRFVLVDLSDEAAEALASLPA